MCWARQCCERLHGPLDLVIPRSDDDIISDFSIDSSFIISDHAAIHFYLKLKKPVFDKKLITFRKLPLISLVLMS